MAAVQELFAKPWFAVLLGLAVGVCLIAPVLWGARFFSSGRVDVGLWVVMGSVFGGLLIALGLLFGYRAVAPTGFVWFGAAVIAGFVAMLAVAAVRAALDLLGSGEETRR